LLVEGASPLIVMLTLTLSSGTPLPLVSNGKVGATTAAFGPPESEGIDRKLRGASLSSFMSKLFFKLVVIGGRDGICSVMPNGGGSFGLTTGKLNPGPA